MLLMLTLIVISLAVVVVPWVLWHQVWQRAARTARTYLLVPCGTRPDDLADVGTSVAAALGQCSSQRHCGVVVHRFRDDQMVRTALTVYGHSDPDRIATQIAGAIRATSQPAHDLDLPSDPTHVHYVRRLDYRGRDPNDDEVPAPSTAADWISTLLGGGSHGVCLSVVLEPAGRWDRRQLRRWHMARAGRSDDMEGVGPGRAIRTSIVTFDPTLAARSTRSTTTAVGQTSTGAWLSVPANQLGRNTIRPDQIECFQNLHEFSGTPRSLRR